MRGEHAAKYVPLDPCDFEEREDVPYSGWPVDHSHLEPFYVRAQKLCGLGPFAYDGVKWSRQMGLLHTGFYRVKDALRSWLPTSIWLKAKRLRDLVVSSGWLRQPGQRCPAAPFFTVVGGKMARFVGMNASVPGPVVVGMPMADAGKRPREVARK